MLNKPNLRQRVLSSTLDSLRQHLADSEEGPHRRIGDWRLRALWKEWFEGREAVPWVEFMAVFPSQAQGACSLSDEEHKVGGKKGLGEGDFDFGMATYTRSVEEVVRESTYPHVGFD